MSSMNQMEMEKRKEQERRRRNAQRFVQLNNTNPWQPKHPVFSQPIQKNDEAREDLAREKILDIWNSFKRPSSPTPSPTSAKRLKLEIPNNDPVIEKIMEEVKVPVLILPLEAAKIHHEPKSSSSNDAMEKNKDLKLASKSVKSRNSDTENEVPNQKKDDEQLKKEDKNRFKPNNDPVIEKIMGEVQVPVLILPLEASKIHHELKSTSSKDAMEKNKDLKHASKSVKSRNSATENEVLSKKKDDERRKRKKEDDPVIEKIMGEVQIPVLILPLEAARIHHRSKSSTSKDAMERNKDLKLASKSVKSRNSDTENEVPSEKRDDERRKRKKEDDPVIEKIMGEVQVPVLILPLEASKIHHEPKSSSSEDAISRNSDTENEVPNQKRDDEQLKRTKEDKNHPSSLAKENKIIKMIFRKDLSKSTVEVPFYSAILR